MPSIFDSFDQSPLGAFIQSGLGVRGLISDITAVGNKALLSGRNVGTGWTSGTGAPKFGQDYLTDVWRADCADPDSSPDAVDTLDLADYSVILFWNLTANLTTDEKNDLVSFIAGGGWVVVVQFVDDDNAPSAPVSYANDLLDALSSPMDFVAIDDNMVAPITVNFGGLSFPSTFNPDTSASRVVEVTGGTAIVSGDKNIGSGQFSSAAWDETSRTFAIGFQPNTDHSKSATNRRFWELVYEQATDHEFPSELTVCPDDITSTPIIDSPAVVVETALTITSIFPTGGASGTNVLVSGTGFTASTNVVFGSTDADNISMLSSSLISCDSPSGESGVVDVKVEEGVDSDTLSNGYDYDGGGPPPPPP